MLDDSFRTTWCISGLLTHSDHVVCLRVTDLHSDPMGCLAALDSFVGMGISRHPRLIRATWDVSCQSITSL